MDRCALCPGTHHCVAPSGPCRKGDTLFVGEAPGKDENIKHMPFVGKTGQEVNQHYLPLAGLQRSSSSFINAIACMPPSAGGKINLNQAKSRALLESCAEMHLYPLIERMQPKLIVPMGAFACEAIDPDLHVDIHHGHPRPTRWGIPAFPMNHPARGIHEPKVMLHIREDWMRLKSYLAGTLALPYDEYPEPDYAEITDPYDIGELDPTQSLGGDTEFDRFQEPFCLTLSQTPGTGRLIQANRPDILHALQARLRIWEAPILFHNWLADAPIVAKMGLQFPHHRLVDTMLLAYHLGILPQGLKALAFRELGMAMEDFSDLVAPFSTEKVLRYLRLAYAEEWPKPEADIVRGDDGQWVQYKPQGMKTKLKRFFTDYVKSDGEKDVFKSWDNWEASQAMIEEQCGPFPGLCITHVPFEHILPYACRDADALIRLYPILKAMKRQVRKTTPDHWRKAA